MAYARKRSVRPKGVKRRFKSRRIPRKRAPLRSIKTMVKRYVAQQAEKKSNCYSSTLSLGTLQSTSSTLVGNMLCITPTQSTFSYGSTLGQSAGDNGRIGNQINIKSLRHAFAIYPNAYNATLNPQPRPCIVRLYYFKSKLNPASDIQLSQICGSSANFFDNSSSDTGFSGSLLDLNRRIQNQNYTYLTHRTYKVGNSNPVYGGASVEYYPGSNNDFKLSVVSKVELGRFCKGKYTFNDANAVTSKWIWCIMQVVCADGSVLPVTQSLVSMQSQMYVEYTDE